MEHPLYPEKNPVFFNLKISPGYGSQFSEYCERCGGKKHRYSECGCGGAADNGTAYDKSPAFVMPLNEHVGAEIQTMLSSQTPSPHSEMQDLVDLMRANIISAFGGPMSKLMGILP